MKTFWSSNSELEEILAENGIIMTVNENMEVVISDEDAERIASIVEEFAPAASGDYCIEDIDE